MMAANLVLALLLGNAAVCVATHLELGTFARGSNRMPQRRKFLPRI